MKASIPSGRWGGFMKASTHGSGVGVDTAAVERDYATVDVYATSGLPTTESRQQKRAPQGGDGVVSCCRKRLPTYILRADKGGT